MCASPAPTTELQTGRRLRRLGALVLSAGFLAALAAAVLLGRRIEQGELLASLLHRTALLTMLLGFCLWLAGNRAAQLIRRFANLVPGDAALAERLPLAAAVIRSEWTLAAAIGTGLLGLVLLPPGLAMWLTLLLTSVVAVCVGQLLVCGRGGHRAFAVGSLVPAVLGLLAAISGLVFTMLWLLWALHLGGDVVASLLWRLELTASADLVSALQHLQFVIAGTWLALPLFGGIALLGRWLGRELLTESRRA